MSNGGSMMSYKQAIKRNEKRIRESYTALGIRAYNLIKQGALSYHDLDIVAAEIDAIAAENASYEQAIMDIKAAREAARGVRCASCGTMGSPGSKFCPGCGMNMAEPVVYAAMVACSACGGMTDGDSRFCVICGAQLAVVGVPETVQAEPVQAEPVEVEQAPEGMAQDRPEQFLAESEGGQGIDAAKCSHCGDLLEEGAEFCGFCGERIGGK